jgi:hypothetical protein
MKHQEKNEAKGEILGHSVQPLLNLSMIPLVLITWLEGKALRPFLAEMLGLSPSRLRRGNGQNLRESTLIKAKESAETWLRERALKNGWGMQDISERRSSLPSVLAGQPRPFADFIHGLENPDYIDLPLAKTFAEEVDCLANSLLLANQANDLESFKQVILNCGWGEGLARSIADQDEADQRLTAFAAATDWDEAFAASRGFADNIMICLFAAIDVEFGATYLRKLQPRPLLPLLQPKMNADFNPDSLDKLPRRNLVYRPPRRLLELCYALMFWAKTRRWPSKPVGRKVLSEKLHLADYVVGNWFDGTKSMNSREFESIWKSLCINIAKQEPFPAPMPLFLATVFLQNVLIATYPNQKLKHVILLDEANYLRYWTWHRQRWASQLHQGTEGWPTWLDDQSSLSPDSEARSSQSAGRSSSSRECQYSSLLGLS